MKSGPQHADPAEVALIDALLHGAGPGADRLLAQAQAGQVERSRRGPSFRMAVVATDVDLLVPTVDDLLPPGEPDFASPWIEVHIEPGRRLALFRLVLARGGLLEALEGHATRGRWPRRWGVDLGELDRLIAGGAALRLPSLHDVLERRDAAARGLGAWLGDDGFVRRHLAHVTFGPPAAPYAVANAEAREGVRLPDEYRTLLSLADGLTVGDLEIAGSQSCRCVEAHGEALVAIGREGGAGTLALDETGAVVVVAAAGPELVARSLRDLVRGRLAG